MNSITDKIIEELNNGLSKTEKRKESSKQTRGKSTRNCSKDDASPKTFEELDNETIKRMKDMIEKAKILPNECNNKGK